ncbi:restriction endonuclease subunit S [Listeria booriae]|uniref:Restriction endonuclease subunit S n=1 Tax=Listeria booriae TaxID=1552123 RepID=A0A7X1CJI8_9LIST|nr:restriction endonuclease subunit S [Listeria booriae]MBC1780102.1 restriction endonuclease subunit S [Listeria booriae]
MSDKKRNVPALRFNGFSDAWEQRKLGELADIVGGGTPATNNKEYWNGDIDWYSPSEIGKQRYISESRKKITKLGLQKSSAKLLPVGTILFTSRAGIGNTAILMNQGATNQGFQSIIPNKEKLDSYFIYSRTDDLKKYGEMTGVGSTFLEVSGKQMTNMPILTPTLAEQQIIGAFFQHLDNTIALHQRKLDTLKQMKKGFLQQLFPENGEKLPRVRFADFEEEWEQRKLGELVKFFSGLTYSPNNIVNEDGTLVLRSSNVNSGEIIFTDNVYVDCKTVNSSNVQVGDIIVVVRNGSRNLIGKHAIIKKEMNNTVIGAFMIGIRSNKSDFVNVLLDTQQFRIGISKNLGATINQITTGAFKQMAFSIPKNVEEQQQIGAFFKQLDNIVTLHKNNIDRLKALKKAYIKSMFV